MLRKHHILRTLAFVALMLTLALGANAQSRDIKSRIAASGNVTIDAPEGLDRRSNNELGRPQSSQSSATAKDNKKTDKKEEPKADKDNKDSKKDEVEKDDEKDKEKRQRKGEGEREGTHQTAATQTPHLRFAANDSEPLGWLSHPSLQRPQQSQRTTTRARNRPEIPAISHIH